MASPTDDPSDLAEASSEAPPGTTDEWPPLVALVERIIDGLSSWGLVTALVLIAPGLAMWPLAHAEFSDYVIANDLHIVQRWAILQTMGWLAVPVALTYLGYHLARTRQIAGATLGDSARRLNRFSFVILAAPLLAVLAHRGIEKEHPFLALVLIAICTGLIGVFTHRVLGLRAPPSAPERVRWWWLPPLIATGLAVAYAGYASHLALLDHHNLGTHTFDLGVYDNVFWRTVNGDFLGCGYCKADTHLSAHFDPILALFSPIYRLYPRAETILVLQSVWLATAAAPLYLLAERRLANPWFGVLLVAITVLYPPLHGVNQFDFHSLTLAVPTLIWAIYFIDSGARWRYWLVLGLLLLTREDMSFVACFVGAYAVLKRRPITGLATVGLAVSYLAFVKLVMMNDPGLMMAGGKDSHAYGRFYADMIPHASEGLRGLVISLVTNPGTALKVLLLEDKVLFGLLLLGPLLFLPLVAGRKRFIMLYGLVFLGLASRPHMFSIHYQYSSVLFPVLLASLPDGIARTAEAPVVRAMGLQSRRLAWTLMWTSLAATTLISIKFGAFVPNDSFRAGWDPIVYYPKKVHRDRYRRLTRLIDEIPADASVSSTTDLGPHVSNRRDVMKWPAYRDADYLLLRTRKLDAKDRRRLKRIVTQGEYRRIEAGLGMQLFERVPPAEREAVREAIRQKQANEPDPVEEDAVEDDAVEDDAVEDAEGDRGDR